MNKRSLGINKEILVLATELELPECAVTSTSSCFIGRLDETICSFQGNLDQLSEVGWGNPDD